MNLSCDFDKRNSVITMPHTRDMNQGLCDNNMKQEYYENITTHMEHEYSNNNRNMKYVYCDTNTT